MPCGRRRGPSADAAGLPGFAQYRSTPEGAFRAFALQVIETSDGRISTMTSFHDAARLFPLFGLPLELPAQPGRVGRSTRSRGDAPHNRTR